MEFSEGNGRRIKGERFFRRKVCFGVFRGMVVLIFLLLSAAATPASAQTLAEWLRQNATQIKYLRIQIGFLVLYDEVLHKGYSISKAGLGLIGNYTGTELGLHQDHIRSLKQVSTAVKADPEAARVGVLDQDIRKDFDGLPDLSGLTADERSYVSAVKSEMLSACSRYGQELSMVLEAGKLEMTDDERLRRVHGVYGAMRDAAAFSGAFCVRVRLLIAQRVKELGGVHSIQQVYGID